MSIKIKGYGAKPPWLFEFAFTTIIPSHLVKDFTALSVCEPEAVEHRLMLLGKLFEATTRRILAMTVDMTDDQIDNLSRQEDVRANKNQFPDIYGKPDGNILKLDR
jgi:hypothetical protein